MNFDKVINFFSKIGNAFYYHTESQRKIYTCKLLDGYSFLDDGSIEVKIKQFGRGNLIIIKAQDLFENEHLMNSLNPYDVAKLSFIALGEYLCKFPNEEKESAFKKFLSKIQKEE